MDMSIKEMRDKKMNILTKMLNMTKSTVFGNDTNVNIRRYTTLYSRRASMIDEIKEIDFKIKNDYKEEPTTNEMNVVIQKIIDEDNRISKYEDEFVAFLEEKENEK